MAGWHHHRRHPSAQGAYPGRRRSTQLVLSRKPLGMLVSGSSHEELFHKVAELDTTVTQVRAQPCTLLVAIGGRLSRQTPDAAVMVDGRAELHEVKEAVEFAKADVKAELLEVRDEVERHGRWHYSVTLDTDLRTEPLLTNTDLLWRAHGDEYDQGLEMRTRELLDDVPLAIGEVLDRLRVVVDHADVGLTWESLLSMICDGVIDYDVNKKITCDSLVWTTFSGPARLRTLPFRRPLRRSGAAATPPTATPFLGMAMRGAR